MILVRKQSFKLLWKYFKQQYGIQCIQKVFKVFIALHLFHIVSYFSFQNVLNRFFTSKFYIE